VTRAATALIRGGFGGLLAAALFVTSTVNNLGAALLARADKSHPAARPASQSQSAVSGTLWSGWSAPPTDQLLSSRLRGRLGLRLVRRLRSAGRGPGRGADRVRPDRTARAGLIAIWHLPLFFLVEGGPTVDVVVPGLLTTIAVTYWYAWLFNRTGGSSLVTLVAHSVEGAFSAEGWLYAFAWCVVAVARSAAPVAWRGPGWQGRSLL
jgi:hypothetical protein